MKKLVLIKPVDPHYGRSLRKRGAGVPPVALGILAALTPKDWQVRIIDENSAPFAYAEADLVGLTAFTNTAPRAYQIAQLYRQAGVPTIMGGIHASMLPDEALQYVDCVVLGEAEAVWPSVIGDFEAGHLQRTYRGGFPELKDMPVPRYDLFPRGCIGAVQTTRGCPMNCDFCSVTAFNGNRYRHRPVEEVLDELERIPKKIVAFLDDNIVGHGEQNEQRALALFEGMIRRRLNKLWVGLASMNLADNQTVLEYAARSGCLMAMIGVEAENADALREMNKTANLIALKKSYEEVFRRVHKHGIAIHGYFMYGLDVDSPDSLRKRTEFIKACSIDSVGVSILCPFPGTPLYERMRREERLRYTNFPQDWVHYDYSQVAHRPKRMSPEMLEQLVSEACGEIYGYGAIRARFFRAIRATRGVRPAICALRYNLRQRWLKL
jgi:radical SAM superfamily enzyme YgiQ (UPF0313 family)